MGSEPKPMTAEDRVRAVQHRVTSGHGESADVVCAELAILCAEHHAAAAVAEVTRERDEELRKAMRGGALRRCDSPACNCDGYHSDYARRMVEIADERDAALARVAELEAEVERLRELVPLAWDAGRRYLFSKIGEPTSRELFERAALGKEGG